MMGFTYFISSSCWAKEEKQMNNNEKDNSLAIDQEFSEQGRRKNLHKNGALNAVRLLQEYHGTISCLVLEVCTLK
jgi:hypothetical protein